MLKQTCCNWLARLGEEQQRSMMEKGRKVQKRGSKTGFEAFLEMDIPKDFTAREDLELERKLAKKLGIKRGKLGGEDDDLNILFGDTPSVLDSLGEEGITGADEFSVKNSAKSSPGKKRKKRKQLESGVEGGVVVGELNSVETNGEDLAAEEAPAKSQSRNKRKKKKKKKLLGQEHKDGVGAETSIEVLEPVGTAAAETALDEAPAKATGMGASVKYVAPHLRSRSVDELGEHHQVRRQVRGLLNRLSESNVESIAGEMSSILRSVGRSFGSQIISEEVLASCVGGPRGNEQYAAVFAAFVAGMACLLGVDFSAKLVASLAKAFEDEYNKEDNLSLRNLTLLLAYLYIFDVFASDLIYDFLIILSKQLQEIDVSTILTILQCSSGVDPTAGDSKFGDFTSILAGCGMKLRRDDPASMKDFILSVQNRVNELKASSGNGKSNISNKRMEFMLETICDIKNNKKRAKEETVQHTRINKWLQKLRVEDILIRGLKWSKLLDPNKKGQWWLSGNMTSATENVEEVATKIDKEVLEAQKMLQLAAAQRMNTDARRAIFCIIMSGEDYLDAFEKLLRLDLPGKQDRDIVRVLLECCLQEEAFNKYYAILASKLCDHDKNQKFTLQYCLWDHFKELDSMKLSRSMHLAKFVAEMLASFTLSLSVLKAVDLSDARQLTPRRIMHFRILFEAIFEHPDKLVWNMFTRIAVAPELETLRNGIQFFIREYVVSNNQSAAKKFKVAKKALNNLEGVLM